MGDREIKIKFLGSGDAFSSRGLFNSCYYVSSPVGNFLVDCGATALTALKRYNISTNDIDYIIITHFHGDHFAGLPFVLLDAGYVAKREKPLTIITPTGGKKIITELANILYPGTDLIEGIQVKFLEFEDGDLNLATFVKISILPVIHKEEALPHGVKLEVMDKIIAFSGDTGWNDNIPALSNRSDVFICECTSYNKELSGHLNYQVLLKNISLLNTRRLVLSHLGEDLLANRGNVKHELAEDGKEIWL